MHSWSSQSAGVIGCPLLGDSWDDAVEFLRAATVARGEAWNAGEAMNSRRFMRTARFHFASKSSAQSPASLAVGEIQGPYTDCFTLGNSCHAPVRGLNHFAR